MLPASRSKDYSPRAAGYLYATSKKLKKKKKRQLVMLAVGAPVIPA